MPLKSSYNPYLSLVITVFLAVSLAIPLSSYAADEFDYPNQITAENTDSLIQGDLLLKALGLLGTPYKYGGTTPTQGFDCSGLVRHVFSETLGIQLPHRSEQLSKIGEKIAKDQLQPGDLVFFNTLKHTFSHVGIYLGEQRFIHAASHGKEVRIDNMEETYWRKRFNGARRVEAAGLSDTNMLAPINHLATKLTDD